MKLFYLSILSVCLSISYAQELDSIIEPVLNNNQYIIENLQKGDEFSSNDDILNDFEFNVQNKLNLNTCSQEELLRLNILNIFQINNLLNYREINGEIYSFFELNSIHTIDKENIEKLKLYCEILPPVEDGFIISELANYITKSQHQLILRSQGLLQKPKAYTSNEGNYLGNRFRIYTNYKMSYSDLLRFGFTLEKDPGESFNITKSKPQPFDFSSLHLELGKIFFFKKIIVGDYKLEYGQGLNSWTSYAPSKSSSNLSKLRFSRGGLIYSGSNEVNFMRGIYNEIEIKNLSISSYFSFRRVDSRYIEENNSFKMLSSGFHRSPNELETKNNISKQDYGLHLKYRYKFAKIGLNFSNTIFSENLSTGQELYQSDFIKGKNFSNYSIDYLINFNNIFISGEFAVDKNMNIASIANAQLSLHNLNLFLSYRNYDKNFSSLNWNPFSEYSNKNETGLFISLESDIHKYLSVKAYLDIFKNTWLQYNKNFPERGFEYQVALNSKITRSTQVSLLLKSQHKKSKFNTELDFIPKSIDENKQSIRISLDSKINSFINLRTTYEHLDFKINSEESSYLAYQELIFNISKIRSKLSLRATLFNVSSWNSRIYTYERDLLYSLSFPAYYDKGNSFYLLVNHKLNRHFSFWFKFSHLIFDDKEYISSGPNEINGNRKTEIKLQMRIKF